MLDEWQSFNVAELFVTQYSFRCLDWTILSKKMILSRDSHISDIYATHSDSVFTEFYAAFRTSVRPSAFSIASPGMPNAPPPMEATRENSAKRNIHPAADASLLIATLAVSIDCSFTSCAFSFSGSIIPSVDCTTSCAWVLDIPSLL